MLGGPTEGWDEQEVIIVEEKDEYFTSMEIMIKRLFKDPPLIDQGDSCSVNKKGKHT